MTIRVITLGCKVNQCESASIVATLKANNFNASEGMEPADVYVLNTCSVTAEADKKSRQYISKLCKLNPNCSIIVVGCSTKNAPEKFNKHNVYAIGSTVNKSEFVLNCANEIYKNNHYSILPDRILYDKSLKSIEIDRYCYECYPISDRTRAFVKIQDGCNRFCSYCIIPYLRGRSRSRSIEDIVKECEAIKSKEIVLIGIDVSAYGKDTGESFCDLINALSHIDARKRLGSLECEIIDENVLDAMKAGNYCPHFHLSLQSGSSAVLKTMNRHYDSDFYYKKVELIRKYYTNAGITTDVIVGFPTETDEFFKESCEFIEKCEFSDIHVFPYSSREGTLAAKKYKPLPSDIVKNRVNILLDLKRRLHTRFISKNLDLVMPVYVEDSENGYNVGYTPNYIKVYSNAACGDVFDVRLKKTLFDGVFGEPIDH